MNDVIYEETMKWIQRKQTVLAKSEVIDFAKRVVNASVTGVDEGEQVNTDGTYWFKGKHY